MMHLLTWLGIAALFGLWAMLLIVMIVPDADEVPPRLDAGHAGEGLPCPPPSSWPTCDVGQCPEPYRARGMCDRHYWRAWRGERLEP
jgi:hypothetical protein